MNIVLIGYRGTGKSEVAARLSQQTGMNRISLDAEIVKEAGMSIPEIVASHGWDWFRDLEAELTARYSSRDNLILDTGGGVILRPDNVANLKKNGKVFWLTAEVHTIAARIETDTNRPALVAGKTFIEEIEEVLDVRRPLYAAAADHTVATDALSPDEIARSILAFIRQW